MAASTSRAGKRKFSELPPETIMVEGSLPLLKKWWDEMDPDLAKIAKRMIGKLPYLIHKDLIARRDLVCALYRFWDPSRNTFRFTDFEMTPTLEEIAIFASLNLEGKKVIAPEKMDLYKFFKYLKLVPDPSVDGVQKGWISLQYLYDRFGDNGGFQKHREEFFTNLSFDKWMGLRPHAFSIAFLGLMIFPLRRHRISIRLGGVVHSFFDKVKDATIVPMILGSIFRSLTRCRERKENFFRGCNLLLQIWFLEHLLPRPPRSPPKYRLKPYSMIPEHPARVRDMPFPDTHKGWVSLFGNLRIRHILWQYEGFPFSEVITSCLERPFLPLMDLYGCQPYPPARVLRQLGRAQEIPLVEDMSRFTFDYGTKSAIPSSELWGMWDRRILAKIETQIEDRFAGVATQEYPSWYISQPRLEARPPRFKEGVVDQQARYDLKLKMAVQQHAERFEAELTAARVALAESQEIASGHVQTIAKLRGLLDAARYSESRQTEMENRLYSLTKTADELRRDRDAAYAVNEDLIRAAEAHQRRLADADAAIGGMRQTVHDLAEFVADSIITYEHMPPEEIGRHAIPVVGKVVDELILMQTVIDTVPPPEEDQHEP